MTTASINGSIDADINAARTEPPSKKNQNSRSSFYTSDTLLPPQADNTVGNKLSSVFGRVSFAMCKLVN